MKIKRTEVKKMIELARVCIQKAKEKDGFLILRGSNGKMIKKYKIVEGVLNDYRRI